MQATLDVHNVTKSYGPKRVVDDVTFSATRGECLGIIGPNGAGKTTLFNLLDGTVRADGGRVVLDGQELSGLPQYRRARLGMGRAYQVPRPFVGLTVYENVLAGTMLGGTSGTSRARARHILETVGLAHKSDIVAGGLSLLDRKRLELARAMSVGSQVLLLDEIAGGLTEPEILELIEVVRALKAEHAVLWIEHIAHALMAVADRLIVLHFGAKLMDGDPRQVMNAPIVQEIYLGISVDEPAHA